MHWIIDDPNEIPVIRKLHQIATSTPIDHPCFKELAIECSADSFTVKRALISLFSYTRSPPGPPVINPDSDLSVSVDHHGSHIGTGIWSFRLGPWICFAPTWRDFITKLCQILFIEHPDDFAPMAWKVSGPRRVYFAKSEVGLDAAKKLGDEVYLETNLAANNCVSLANTLARAFGYEPPEINPTELSRY